MNRLMIATVRAKSIILTGCRHPKTWLPPLALAILLGGSTGVNGNLCVEGPNEPNLCSVDSDCPDGICYNPASLCVGGSKSDLDCVVDADCPGEGVCYNEALMPPNPDEMSCEYSLAADIKSLTAYLAKCVAPPNPQVPAGIEACEDDAVQTFGSYADLTGCPSCIKAPTIATIVKQIFDEQWQIIDCPPPGTLWSTCTVKPPKLLTRLGAKYIIEVAKVARTNFKLTQSGREPITLGSRLGKIADQCASKSKLLPPGCCLVNDGVGPEWTSICASIRLAVEANAGLVACAGEGPLFPDPPVTVTSTTLPHCGPNFGTCDPGYFCACFTTCLCVPHSTPTTTTLPTQPMCGNGICEAGEACSGSNCGVGCCCADCGCGPPCPSACTGPLGGAPATKQCNAL